MTLSMQYKFAKGVIARAITCAGVMALPGCFIPHLRPANTGVVLPPTYDGGPSGTTNGSIQGSATSDNSAQLRVDEFYNDVALTQLVCQAVANNRELKMLEEEIQVARAEIIARRGAFLPSANFQVGGGWDRSSRYTPVGAAEKEIEYLPGKRFPNTPAASLLGINFLLPLDIWRELRNSRDAAMQRYFAAIEKRNYFVTQMVADIAQSYYSLMALDQRLATLDQIIAFQQKSLDVAQSNFNFGRDSNLPVRRFEAEVHKNVSEKLIVKQEIVEVENRINYLAGRFPQPVERNSTNFYDLTIHTLSAGVPSQLLLNRPDIRQAERELQASGLDIQVARAHFFPTASITGSIGYAAFNPRYLFTPEALVFNAFGQLTAPLINRSAIRAEYLSANARQLESVYNYQRTILNAVTEVVNRLSAVDNYTRSINIKKQQLQSLEAAVVAATDLWQLPREKAKGQADYLDVLTVQRDLLEARTVVINTRRQLLSSIVNVYQSLGGGSAISCPPPDSNVAAITSQPVPGAYTAPTLQKENERTAPGNMPQMPLPAPLPQKLPVAPAPVPGKG